MKDFLGYVLTFAAAIGLIVLYVRSRPGNVKTRRHERFKRRFEQAKTPADKVQQASNYLHEVVRDADVATTAAIALELFALASKRNTTPAAPARKAPAAANTD